MRVLLLVFVTVALWGQNTGMVLNLQSIKSEYAVQIANAFNDGKVKYQLMPGSSNFVMSGPPESMAVIENAIRKADVPELPSPNVELIFYVLSAGDSMAGGPLPDELAGVAKQVKGVLGVAALRLIESIQLRTRVGRGSSTSGILGKAAGAPSFYNLSFIEVAVQGGSSGRSLRVSGFKFGARIHNEGKYLDTGFNTDVDLREGQKIVIGKSSFDASGNPYFVVVTGKVVD